MSRDTGIVAVRKTANRFNIVDRDEMEIIAVVYKGSKTDEEHESCAQILAAGLEMYLALARCLVAMEQFCKGISGAEIAIAKKALNAAEGKL